MGSGEDAEHLLGVFQETLGQMREFNFAELPAQKMQAVSQDPASFVLEFIPKEKIEEVLPDIWTNFTTFLQRILEVNLLHQLAKVEVQEMEVEISALELQETKSEEKLELLHNALSKLQENQKKLKNDVE